MIIKNDDLFEAYKFYFKHNIFEMNREHILDSLLEEVKTADRDIENIYNILIKLSIIAKIDFITFMKEIKNKDDASIKNNKHSKEIIDYSLEVIIKLLNEMDDEEINSFYYDTFCYNENICHTARVFIMSVQFMKYYNNSIDNNIVLDIKREFKDKYAGYYEDVVKKFKMNKKITKLEHVYKDGLRDILFNEIINISIAAFWHDISNVLINDNGEEYHILQSYSYLKHFIRYNDDISLTVGLHNEYYGYGKGVFLNYYNAAVSDSDTFDSLNYIMSFDSSDTLRFNSISYFPSKVLEIIDLFDKISYSNDTLSNDEVLSFIGENYLYNEVHIDPIIFDIFSSFIYDNIKLTA